ncbi:hypothetical protein Anapl_03897 [Anas platyrhynchos]|uniref:Uncharacterized protein n=1 Tax=Anas platyrhynchos TaxID=8839 RepID=R0L6X8_ANAPL|nr:hypothetical protein Anapl_03897 [Anas platyrhynchos]
MLLQLSELRRNQMKYPQPSAQGDLTTPQRASCSDKFSPGNNSCRRVPPSLWSWLLGCEALCPPESEMLSSSADSTNKEPGSRGMVLSPQDQLGYICQVYPKPCQPARIAWYSSAKRLNSFTQGITSVALSLWKHMEFPSNFWAGGNWGKAQRSRSKWQQQIQMMAATHLYNIHHITVGSLAFLQTVKLPPVFSKKIQCPLLQTVYVALEKGRETMSFPLKTLARSGAKLLQELGEKRTAAKLYGSCQPGHTMSSGNTGENGKAPFRFLKALCSYGHNFTPLLPYSSEGLVHNIVPFGQTVTSQRLAWLCADAML